MQLRPNILNIIRRISATAVSNVIQAAKEIAAKNCSK